MRDKILVLFIIWLAGGRLFAQPDQSKFTRINIDQGLSHNQINSILKDRKGYMWFGTMSGLNRYDGHSFKVFKHDVRDSASISNNYIQDIFEGPEGKIWVSTRSGLNVYDPETDIFHRDPRPFLQKLSLPGRALKKMLQDQKGDYWMLGEEGGLYKYSVSGRRAAKVPHLPADSSTVGSDQIAAIAEGPQGTIWVIHRNGILEQLNRDNLRVTSRTYVLHRKYRGELLDYGLFVDADGSPWVFLGTDARGVFYFDASRHTLLHLHKSSGNARLNTDIVRDVAQDNRGLIWIATDHGGINLLDKKDFSVQYLLHNPDDEKSLSQNSVNTLYKDNTGIVWAGTFKKGISYFHQNIVKFPLFNHQASNPRSLPFDDINRFVEDARGNLWIGTNGGGLLYFDRANGQFTQFLHNPADPNSLSNDVIVSLHLDHQQKLWIGTYFGGLDCYDGTTFTHYRHDPARPESLADNRVWEIFEDSQKNLWIGTFAGGLDRFDREKGIFHHYWGDRPYLVPSSYISALTEDREGNLWVGSGHGIDVLDKKSGRFTHYLNDKNNPRSLSNNTVTSILEGSQGWMWIGTHEGLNIFDKATQTFRVFREEDGLPSNMVRTILEDNAGNFWLGTTKGISQVTVSRSPQAGKYALTFKNYDESDGFQGIEFNEYAAHKTRAGELIFGGGNGFNLFRPAAISVNRNVPPVVITDFQIFNKSVAVGEVQNGRIILKKAVNEIKEITLKHDENVFSLEFAALSYFQPEKNRYAYRLEGFSRGWLSADGNSRKATYTNLDPGEYVFRVKAANNDNIWNEEGASLRITVLPPFWKSPPALFLYACFIIGALLLARQLTLAWAQLHFRIEQERQEAHRVHELNMMKIRFFTNVSHEFRTPLTLILSPLDKLLKNTSDPDEQNHFLLIQRNARRLLNLVNQLLDFRKLEVQEFTLNPAREDIVEFVRELAHSFSDLSEKKNIQFSFLSTLNHLEIFFDPDKLEKIMFNLLSNAFKFTPAGGMVAVEVQLREPEAGAGLQWLEIKVKDTGIGIPVEKHGKIFERFFQHDVPGTMVNQGSGIGLAITKEFVKLHGGGVTVESEPGQGSCFTVSLPVKETAETGVDRPAPEAIRTLQSAEDEPSAIVAPAPRTKQISKKPVVMLIEDNEDFRFYLKDNLREQYTILEAPDGKGGWDQVYKMVPDLIVSDIMMPGMDGMALCRKVKNDRRTAHIPVILLTANASEEQKLKGFETGANDFITKPFNFEILQSRIKNLLIQQTSLRHAFEKKIEVRPQDVKVASLDEKLIQKAMAVVEQNMANPDFSVEEFSRELGMSRVHLYKKLLSLTGKSPIEFIRTMRLKRAAQLLKESQLTVSEIAYEVGFNNPKYFTRYFKLEFNSLPSLYAAEKR